jgi:hypothetical protein
MNMEALPPNHRDLSLCARIAGREQVHTSTRPHNPGPESALELLPSSALPSAQVFKAYPKIAALENRTFHLLFKPDILTCYQHAMIRPQPQRCLLQIIGGVPACMLSVVA